MHTTLKHTIDLNRRGGPGGIYDYERQLDNAE